MKTNKAFTLLEVLIVLVIIGIIAAIAYPSYTSQAHRAKRADAHIALNELAGRMERYYTANNSYASATITKVFGAAKSAEGYYKLKITNLEDNAYTLAAIPDADGAQAKDKCGTLTLSSTGVRGAAMPDCW